MLFRKFRGQETGTSFLIECEQHKDAFIETLGDHPDLKEALQQVIMPGAIPWNLMDKWGKDAGSPITERMRINSIAASTINFWAAYREYKAIYHVEPGLFDALTNTPCPDTYPTAHFRLPYPAIWLQIPKTMGIEHLGVCMDLAAGHEAQGGLELRFVVPYDELGRLTHLHGMDLTAGANLKDASARFLTKVLRRAPSEVHGHLSTATAELWASLIGGILNTILYIQNDEDVVLTVHPGKKETSTSPNISKQRRMKDLATPHEFAVGHQFVSVIEHWESTQARTDGHVTGRHVRPHMRRAHAHLYWTGKGRKIPKVRFIPPTPVKGGGSDEIHQYKVK